MHHYRILYDTLSELPVVDVWEAPAESGSPFVFPIALRDRPVDVFARAMAERGVEVRSLMGGVIADQPAFAALDHDGLTNCRELGGRSCFVGIHQTLSTEAVRTVAGLLAEELGG